MGNYHKKTVEPYIDPPAEEEAPMPETVTPAHPVQMSTATPKFFTICKEGVRYEAHPKRPGVPGQQYTKGQFYKADAYLLHLWKKKDGTVVEYTGDPAAHKIPLHATPNAPYEWTDIETEEAPDLFAGEEEG